MSKFASSKKSPYLDETMQDNNATPDDCRFNRQM